MPRLNDKRKTLFAFLLSLRYHQVLGLSILLGLFIFPQSAQLSTLTPEKIIELTNKERINLNYKPLTANQYLSQAAAEKARVIFDKQVFRHDIGDRKFSSWIKEAGYDYVYAGENLAINFSTSEGVISAWLESPLHRKNLVNSDFEEIGVAVITDHFNGRESNLVVQLFGTPLLRVSRLIPTGYDPAFEELYGVNNMSDVKLLTHTASRYLAQKEGNSAYHPVDTVPGEVNKLFEQLGYQPEKITDIFYLSYISLITGLLFLCYKLMVRHYKFKI